MAWSTPHKAKHFRFGWLVQTNGTPGSEDCQVSFWCHYLGFVWCTLISHLLFLDNQSETGCGLWEEWPLWFIAMTIASSFQRPHSLHSGLPVPLLLSRGRMDTPLILCHLRAHCSFKLYTDFNLYSGCGSREMQRPKKHRTPEAVWWSWLVARGK